MSCVRFKFKSSLEYDKITFDGLQISVGDLRKKIMSLKKLGMSEDFTLQIMDAQSKKIYSNDSEMVPRNTSVIIMRVPVTSHSKLPKTQSRDNGIPKDNGYVSESLKKTGNLAEADATEEEKVFAMMSQAGEDYNPATYAKFKPRLGGSYGSNLVKQPPPPNYVCHRCGQKGHWIKFCPTNGDPSFDNPRIKHTSGIPNSHMILVPNDTRGAMKDRHGNLVKRKVDVLAAANEVKVKSLEPVDTSVPAELTCSICKDLIRDAVIIPCCGESFCDECIREYLLENEFKCFACEETDVSPDTLVPNKRLRNDAKKFQSKITQKKRLAVTRGLPAVVVSQQPDDTSTADTTMDDVLTPPTSQSVSSNPPVDASPDIRACNSPAAPPTASQPLSPPSSSTVETQPTSSPKAPPPSQENQTSSQESSQKESEETDPPTPPLPPIRNKSPLGMSSSTSVPITKPISLSSKPHSINSSGLFPVPQAVMNPLLSTVTHHPALGVQAATLVPPVMYPQPIAHSTLLPAAAIPMPISVPPVAPVIPVPMATPQSTANSLLLQAAALTSQGSMDAAQMARLTELLVAAERKKSPSPAPLSFEEFQRQQKVLRGLDFPPRKSPIDSRSSSYSSSFYSSRSRSPTPLKTRDGRSRSPSYSPRRHHNRYSYSPSSSSRHRTTVEKRKRRHSPTDHKRRHHGNRSSDKQSGSRKSRKRKHNEKSDEYSSPPHSGLISEGEEFDELKSSRKHKKKKRKHSKSEKDLVSKEDEVLSPQGVEGTSDPSCEKDGIPNEVKLAPEPTTNTSQADCDQLTSIVNTNTINTDDKPVSQTTDQSESVVMTPPTNASSEGNAPVVVNSNPADGDTDTLSGGSTPILPHQESLGPSTHRHRQQHKHTKRKKHKQNRSSLEKALEKEKRRHKKHRRQKEETHRDHSKSSSRKKSRKKS